MVFNAITIHENVSGIALIERSTKILSDVINKGFIHEAP